jgi:hypothetical protein
MRKWIAATLVCLPGIAGAEMYRYTADNGTLSYADDLKSIPARYRGSAKRIAGGSLDDYARFSRVQSYPKLDTWTGPAETDAATTPEPGAGPRSLMLRLNGGSALEVPLVSEEPVIVRRSRYAWSEDGYLKPHTIVTQGDRVLAEME